MKIWLIGMMGSGKTSAGKIAASRLGVLFNDTDRLVEAKVGQSVAEYWKDHGEQAFRDIEKSVVQGLADTEGIIATGGGVVLDTDNRALLSSSGSVVWLDATPSALAARVSGSAERPLLAGSEHESERVLMDTMEDRIGLYKSIADHRIPTDDLAAEDVAREIEALWKS